MPGARSHENIVSPALGRRLAPPGAAQLNLNSLEAAESGELRRDPMFLMFCQRWPPRTQCCSSSLWPQFPAG